MVKELNENLEENKGWYWSSIYGFLVLFMCAILALLYPWVSVAEWAVDACVIHMIWSRGQAILGMVNRSSHDSRKSYAYGLPSDTEEALCVKRSVYSDSAATQRQSC